MKTQRYRGWGTGALLGCLLISGNAAAAKLELVPKIGYQFHMSKDLAGPANTTLEFDNESTHGLSLGYLLEDGGQLELSWMRSQTVAQIEKSEGAPTERFDVDIDQIYINGMYMLNSDEVQPYVLVGLGAAHYSASGDHSDNTRFSVALGTGVKWLWNDHIGLRFEGLLTPVLALPGSDFFCDSAGNCASAESNSYFSRMYPFLGSLQLTAGLMLRY